MGSRESRRKERELHWREVVRRQAASGLSVVAFCQQESVSAPSFYSWKRKLDQRDAPAERHQSQTAAISAPLPGNHLVPIRIESKAQSPVRILLPHGVSIEASAEIGESVLASLLHVIREAHAC